MDGILKAKFRGPEFNLLPVNREFEFTFNR